MWPGYRLSSCLGADVWQGRYIHDFSWVLRAKLLLHNILKLKIIMDRYRMYVDIMKVLTFRSIYVANGKLIY